MTSVRCIVSGLVQGVWFRAWTREQALRLGLAGWVRNLPDGRVEILAQGGDEALRTFRGLLPQGPPRSEVSAVECFDVQADPLADFTIRR